MLEWAFIELFIKISCLEYDFSIHILQNQPMKHTNKYNFHTNIRYYNTTITLTKVKFLQL